MSNSIYSPVPCPHCGLMFARNRISMHSRACARMPDADEMQEMLDHGMSMTAIAGECSVGIGTISRAIRDRGLRIPPRDEIIFVYDDSHLAPVDDVICPAYGGWHTCDRSCEYFDRCKRRARAGLWMLCERPSREHVALAYIHGEFGSDGYMPEWLEKSIKELGYDRNG